MQQRPIKLTLLLQDLEFGGTQRYAINLLRHLDRRLFSPELWVLRGGDHMAALADETGVPVIRLTRSSRVTPWAIFRLLVRLLRFPPHLLYTLTVVPNIWGRILGRMARIPTIVSGYRNLFPKQHERQLWPLSDRIICNAHMLQRILVRRFKVSPARIAVVPNGVDVRAFSPVPGLKQREPIILSVGRLVPDKDPLMLLEGFHRVADKLPDARLEIIGNGPLRQKLKTAVAARSLGDRVAILPGTPDIRPYLYRARVFALAAYTGEGSPNVIIEAMAAGLPVVATRVGGTPELVAEGETGFLVDPADPRGLADALILILSDDQLQERLGRKARERITARHGLEQMVRQTEKVLLEAIHDGRPKG